MKTNLYIGLYLFAIVGANSLVGWFGPRVAILTAFIMIGLDLTTRDALHSLWAHNGRKSLVLKMMLLIFSGSVLSYLINHKLHSIAAASAFSFCFSGMVDAAVFDFFKHRKKLFRINASNLASGLVDSILFQTIAFPGFPSLLIILGQWGAKFLGGALWGWILNRKDNA